MKRIFTGFIVLCFWLVCCNLCFATWWFDAQEAVTAARKNAGGGEIVKVGSSSYYGINASITYTVTAGNFVVVYFCWTDTDRTISEVADDADIPNTYTSMTKKVGTSSAIIVAGFRSNIATSKTNATITATFDTKPPYLKVLILEFSGIAASPFDQENSGTASSGTTGLVTGDITTTQNSEVLVSCFSSYNTAYTWLPQADWTEAEETNGTELQYRIVSSTGTYHGGAEQSASTYWAAHVASFKGL